MPEMNRFDHQKNIMKRVIGILLCACTIFSASAQSEIVKKGIALISTQKYSEANLYLDSILKISPNEIDGMMMKGNVILNKHLMEHPSPMIITANDENILADEAQSLVNPPFIPELKTADSVEAIWKKCLTIKPDRNDIQMGLATLYAMSIQTDKLLKQITELKNTLKGGGDQNAYNMLDYARTLRERNRMDEANKIFALVVSLYPKLNDIKSDWAGELLYSGDLKGAQAKATEVLSGDFDAQSRENLNDIFIYSNNIVSLLQTHTKYAKIDSNDRYATLVDGIVRYLGDDEIWKDFLNSKVNQPYFNGDTSATVQFSRFLTSDIYKGSYKDFMFVLSIPTNTLVNWATMRKAVNSFPDSLQFKLIFAEFYMSGKNYTMANSYFQKVLTMKMDSVTRDDIRFIYAYSLYCNKDFKQAIPIFQSLLKDKNVFKKQASMYFAGKMTQNKELLKALIKSEPKTKYVTLAEVLLSFMK